MRSSGVRREGHYRGTERAGAIITEGITEGTHNHTRHAATCFASRGIFSSILRRTRHCASSARAMTAGSKDCDRRSMPITCRVGVGVGVGVGVRVKVRVSDRRQRAAVAVLVKRVRGVVVDSTAPHVQALGTK